MANISANVPLSNTSWTQVLTGNTSAVKISTSGGGVVEYCFATTQPELPFSGHQVLPGVELVIERALVAGVALWMKVIDTTANTKAVRSATIDVYGV